MTYSRYIYISLQWKVIKKSQNCENQGVFVFFAFWRKDPDPGGPKTHGSGFGTLPQILFAQQINRDWISLFDVLSGSWLGSNIQVSEAYLERLSDAAMETYAMVATLSRYSHWSTGVRF